MQARTIASELVSGCSQGFTGGYTTSREVIDAARAASHAGPTHTQPVVVLDLLGGLGRMHQPELRQGLAAPGRPVPLPARRRMAGHRRAPRSLGNADASAIG